MYRKRIQGQQKLDPLKTNKYPWCYSIIAPIIEITAQVYVKGLFFLKYWLKGPLFYEIIQRFAGWVRYPFPSWLWLSYPAGIW
tara:strand:+ start:134 stop:382 length:249 start_codon:yes stop_codon:yes gene_type:complete